MKIRKRTHIDQARVISLLDHRFGDGLVYLESDEDRATFAQALSLGLVSDDGCLTAEGKRLSLRCE